MMSKRRVSAFVIHDPDLAGKQIYVPLRTYVDFDVPRFDILWKPPMTCLFLHDLAQPLKAMFQENLEGIPENRFGAFGGISWLVVLRWILEGTEVETQAET